MDELDGDMLGVRRRATAAEDQQPAAPGETRRHVTAGCRHLRGIARDCANRLPPALERRAGRDGEPPEVAITRATYPSAAQLDRNPVIQQASSPEQLVHRSQDVPGGEVDK